jgi:phosphoribosylaminoimidazole-succinocarboxamide synthase
MSTAITTTDLSSLFKPIAKGKVRDLYELDDNSLLFVATDRISAYDVILDNGVPDKGALLTRLSAHWFKVLTNAIPSLQTHFISLDLPTKLANSDVALQYQGRSMQVRKLKVIPLESIVRGYITGSAWSEYKKHGTVHGIEVPEGLFESQKLDRPLWTPSTKAEQGEHDENISPDKGKAFAYHKLFNLNIADYQQLLRSSAKTLLTELPNCLSISTLQLATTLRSVASSSPTPNSSSALTSLLHHQASSSSMRCLLLIVAASGAPTSTRQVVVRSRSTSSICETG